MNCIQTPLYICSRGRFGIAKGMLDEAVVRIMSSSPRAKGGA